MQSSLFLDQVLRNFSVTENLKNTEISVKTIWKAGLFNIYYTRSLLTVTASEVNYKSTVHNRRVWSTILVDRIILITANRLKSEPGSELELNLRKFRNSTLTKPSKTFRLPEYGWSAGWASVGMGRHTDRITKPREIKEYPDCWIEK